MPSTPSSRPRSALPRLAIVLAPTALSTGPYALSYSTIFARMRLRSSTSAWQRSNGATAWPTPACDLTRCGRRR